MLRALLKTLFHLVAVVPAKHYGGLLLPVLLLLPSLSFAYVSGIDDMNANISAEDQVKIDQAILGYYQKPEVEKVNMVLDIMNNTELLRKKTAWSPLVGFLTVVFASHKDHVFDWMSRNDYNSYAEDVFITALLHAGLAESASVFAQAHGWSADKLKTLRNYREDTDLKKLDIILPGHIDTLWGAFFASGDTDYVDEIINVLFMARLPITLKMQVPPGDVLGENKRLAESTLNYYAGTHEKVARLIKARITQEKDPAKQELLRQLLRSHTTTGKENPEK